MPTVVADALDSPYHGPHHLESGHKMAFAKIEPPASTTYSQVASDGLIIDFEQNCGIRFAEQLMFLNNAIHCNDIPDVITARWVADGQMLQLHVTGASNSEVANSTTIDDIRFDVIVLGR